MKVAEGKVGRVFVLRLEHGDVVPDCIEAFAARERVEVGCALFVGGVGSGEVVVGPEDGDARPPRPMGHSLGGAHEVAAVGVLAPDAEGKPVLHIHGALGREGRTVTGCLRKGVKTWATGEVVLYELLGVSARRVVDPEFGFALLQPAAGASAGDAVAPVAAEGAGEAARPAAPAVGIPPRDGTTKVLYLLNAELH